MMPFRLQNAAQTCQRLMDEVRRGVPGCSTYIDDILLASSSPAEHRQHLQEIFTRLTQYGIRVNRSKCILGVPEVDFLGYHVSAAGIAPLPSRMAEVRNFPTPKTERQLRKFIGMATSYHHTVGVYAILAVHRFKLEFSCKPLNLKPHCVCVASLHTT